MIKKVDPRLGRRYQQLVKEHANSTETLAAGLRALPTASTQAAWRFYQNENITRQIQPQWPIT